MKKILEKIVSDEIESGRLVLGNGGVKEFSIGYFRKILKSQQSIVPLRCDIHYFEYDMEFIKSIYIPEETIKRYTNRDKRDKIISELLD